MTPIRFLTACLVCTAVVAHGEPLEGSYITLWLHQVHQWFGETGQGLELFLGQAHDAGYDAVMTDVPWEWTEREAEGELTFDNFGKDWLKDVCRFGLKLHIVVNMREFPPWISQERRDTELLGEHTDGEGICASNPYPPGAKSLPSPSLGSDDAVRMMKKYTERVASHYVAELGECVASFSPTANNEFETRFAQTFDCMRDYNPLMLEKFAAWQRGRPGSEAEVVEAPRLGLQSCIVHHQEAHALSLWWEFRNERLVNVYGALCDVVFAAGRGRRCLLHMGEMFASTDRLNGNPFFLLARRGNVTDLIMDSNMALFGAPASPSIVGLLVDIARAATRGTGKLVHYEAATERLMQCDAAGALVVAADEASPTARLFTRGIQNALDSGVDALGVTNLCAPLKTGVLLPGGLLTALRSRRAHAPAVAAIPATAVLYAPYRAFAAFKAIVSGVTCGAKPLSCWDPELAKAPTFGLGAFGTHAAEGTCGQDVLQHALLKVWDDLRTRHARVDVVGESAQLTSDMLRHTTERVHYQIDPVGWHFYGGHDERSALQEISRTHAFRTVIAEIPHRQA